MIALILAAALASGCPDTTTPDGTGQYAVGCMSRRDLERYATPSATPARGTPVTYQATVVHTVDGDSFVVHVDGFPAVLDPIEVRVFGIDTPEHVMPPAQKRCEVALGLAASEAAKVFIIPGEIVTLHMVVGRRDKYGRLLSTVTLPDGRDYGALMVAGGHARAYGTDGNLHKPRWC